MTTTEAVTVLRTLGTPNAEAQARRFGIHAKAILGVSAPKLRSLAKSIGTDHDLALALWRTGIHDARILAALIADPDRITMRVMDQWTREIENWAQCDACCLEVFLRSKHARTLPWRWSPSKKEFVRRAGIVMIAVIAVHRKDLTDNEVWKYTPLLMQCADDERNFVKKGVNWALRQIGKRNQRLLRKAVAFAEEMHTSSSRSARWIAADALREFRDPKTIAMVRKRKERI